MRKGQSPLSRTETAEPSDSWLSCESRKIGVTVTVVFNPPPSTIGRQLINVDLLFSMPSNSVVSNVAGNDPPVNLPKFLSALKPAKLKIPSS